MIKELRQFGVEFLPLVLLLAHIAKAQNVSAPSASLVKRFVVLRNFYTNQHLVFDSDGNLTSAGTRGFGPTDGRIYVDDVQTEPAKLIITGNRPIEVYDDKLQQLRPTNINQKVKLEIALPNPVPPQRDMSKLLEKIFLTSAELEKMKCSPAEDKLFLERLERSRELIHGPAPQKWPRAPEPHSIDELQSVCFPLGERAYAGHIGIKPPKAMRMPIPAIPAAASDAHKSGSVITMMIIDAEGTPSSFLVSQSAGYGMDEAALAAIRKWSFKPATFHGTPIPVPIDIKIDFKPAP